MDKHFVKYRLTSSTIRTTVIFTTNVKSYSDILLVNDFRVLNFPFWIGFLGSVSAASPNALSTEKDDRNIGLCVSPKSPLFDRSTRSQYPYEYI